LNLTDENSICPDDANYYVAMGAALMSKENERNSIQ